MIDQIAILLFKYIRRKRESTPKALAIKKGYELEDEVAKEIYTALRAQKLYGVEVFPPRSYLEYPTFSGLIYQFDNVIKNGSSFFPIECKRRKKSAFDELVYFNAKILDYALGSRICNQNLVFKGIFLSTAKMKDNAKCYALAYGIVPIDPFIPPVGYMISSVKEDDPLNDDLIKFKRKISLTQPELLFTSEIDGKELLKEYHYYYRKFKAKGYE